MQNTSPIASSSQPTLSFGEACKLAAEDPRKVTVWYQRGHIKLGALVSARKRELTPLDVLHLAMIVRLAGISTIERASAWSDEAIRQFKEAAHVRLEAPLTELAEWGQGLGLFVFPDGRTDTGRTVLVQDTAYTLHGLESAVARNETPAPFVFVPLGQLLNFVAAAIARKGVEP